MATEFYVHDDGRLRMRAAAGGLGGGQTHTFDGLATEADIAANPGPYHLAGSPPLVGESKPPEAPAAAEEPAVADDAGATGATGATGSTGSTGATGDTGATGTA